MPVQTSGIQGVAVDAADIQVVQNPSSIAAPIANSVISEGAGLYQASVLKQADEATVGVNSQLNDDLGDIDKGIDVGSRVDRELAKMAEENPQIAELTKTLGSLKTAKQQRKGAKVLHALRAEAALKSTLARAPGLRKEVTSIAAKNLGFDPTSATINMILRGIDYEEKTVAEDKWNLHRTTTLLGGYGINVPPEEVTNDNLPALTLKLSQVESAAGAVEQISSDIELGKKNVQSSVMDLYTNSNTLLMSQINPILNTAANIASSLTTEESFGQWMSETKTAAGAALASIKANIRQTYGRIPASPEERELLNVAEDRLYGNVNELFESFLSADNITTFQNRAKSLKILQDGVGLDVFTSSRLLAVYEELSPGIISNLGLQVLVREPHAFNALRDQMLAGFNSLSGEDPRRKGLESGIRVLENHKAFSELDEGQKKEVAGTMSQYLDGYIKLYNENPDLLLEMDHKSVANGFAGMMDLSAQFASSDWSKISLQGSTPAFQDLLTKLKGGDEDSQKMAEILYNGYNESVVKFIKHQFKGDLEDLSMSIDLSTGTVVDKTIPTYVPKDDTANPLTIAKLMWHGSPTNIRIRGKKEADKLQRLIDTVYDKRELDPSLKNLDKGQIAAMITRSLRGSSAVTFVGQAKEFPSNRVPDKVRIQEAELLDNLADSFSRLRDVTQKDVQSEVLKEDVEDIVSLTLKNRTLEAQLAEAKKNLSSFKGTQ